jgi:hypothetical protein
VRAVCFRLLEAFGRIHLQVPLLVAKRTDTAGFEPTLDAVQMKHVSAVTKGNAQTIVVRGRWIGLVFNRGFIEGISTNGALNKYNSIHDFVIVIVNECGKRVG